MFKLLRRITVQRLTIGVHSRERWGAHRGAQDIGIRASG